MFGSASVADMSVEGFVPEDHKPVHGRNFHLGEIDM